MGLFGGTRFGILRLVLLCCLPIVLHIGVTAAQAPAHAIISVDNANKLTQLTTFTQERIYALAWSPDSTRLAIGTANGIWLYDALDEESEPEPIGDSTLPVSSLAFSPDGTLLAFATGNDIRLWNLADASEQATLNGSAPVAFSPDGTLLASGGEQNHVVFWNVADGTQRGQTEGQHSSLLTTLAFVSGSILASGGMDNTLHLWDVSSGSELAVYNFDYPILVIAPHPNGALAALGAPNDIIYLMNLAVGSQQTVKREQGTDAVLGLSFSQAGDLLAFVDDNTIRLWNITESRQSKALTNHSGDVLKVSFSPDGTLLASIGLDDAIRVWGVPA